MMRGRIVKAVLVAALIPALVACGSRRDLRPPAGASLPVAPYGRAQPRTAAELLQPDVQAAPQRNVELRSQSEERADDPFDLPPQG